MATPTSPPEKVQLRSVEDIEQRIKLIPGTVIGSYGILDPIRIDMQGPHRFDREAVLKALGGTAGEGETLFAFDFSSEKADPPKGALKSVLSDRSLAYVEIPLNRPVKAQDDGYIMAFSGVMRARRLVDVTDIPRGDNEEFSKRIIAKGAWEHFQGIPPIPLPRVESDNDAFMNGMCFPEYFGQPHPTPGIEMGEGAVDLPSREIDARYSHYG